MEEHNAPISIKNIRLRSPQEVQEDFKCSVCNRIPEKLSYTCSSGHLICGSEGKNIAKCPHYVTQEGKKDTVCGGSLYLVRMLWFELLVENALYKCPISGCETLIRGQNDADGHISEVHTKAERSKEEEQQKTGPQPSENQQKIKAQESKPLKLGGNSGYKKQSEKLSTEKDNKNKTLKNMPTEGRDQKKGGEKQQAPQNNKKVMVRNANFYATGVQGLIDEAGRKHKANRVYQRPPPRSETNESTGNGLKAEEEEPISFLDSWKAKNQPPPTPYAGQSKPIAKKKKDEKAPVKRYDDMNDNPWSSWNRQGTSKRTPEDPNPEDEPGYYGEEDSGFTIHYERDASPNGYGFGTNDPTRLALVFRLDEVDEGFYKDNKREIDRSPERWVPTFQRGRKRIPHSAILRELNAIKSQTDKGEKYIRYLIHEPPPPFRFQW